jgi:hydroxyacylglutathione hydrolase
LPMSILEIHQIPVLSDNYVYLIEDKESGECAVVDPAVAEPVLDLLDARGMKLAYVLNTHHHGDHTGGNLALKAKTGCKIVGAGRDAARIPGIDIDVGEGDVFQLGHSQARVLEVPGHTSGHIAYWFKEARALFCGDTLFALGCGRLFEGSPAQMWASLSALRSLPGDTRVYCAHEYTQANARFALTVDPDNAALRARAHMVDQLRLKGKPTVPSTLAEECATNPFLRADDSDFCQALGMVQSDPVSVFAETRHRKDIF